MRARTPNELALIDYQNGLKYREIAEKYGVSINTVKSWKSRGNWSRKDKKGVHTKTEKDAHKTKKVCTQKGGQPGNKNATGNKGGAAPLKNKNAVTTGEFETLLFDCLDPDELRLADAVPADKEQLLMQEIQLLTVRERRMLKRIESLRQAEKENTEANKDKAKDVSGKIQGLEDALTRVQDRKQRAIDSLHRFGVDQARLDIEMMKLELATMKLGSQETETEDDGFLDALNAESGSLWGDADDD